MRKKSKQKRLVYVISDWTSIAVRVAKCRVPYDCAVI